MQGLELEIAHATAEHNPAAPGGASRPTRKEVAMRRAPAPTRRRSRSRSCPRASRGALQAVEGGRIRAEDALPGLRRHVFALAERARCARKGRVGMGVV